MSTHAAEVIVIGAGVSGLMAAGELARSGARVVVLEARESPGGRILTRTHEGWPRPLELGAEFVHGGNEILFELLPAAGLKTKPVPGRHWLVEHGLRRLEPDAFEHINEILRGIGPQYRGSFADWLRVEGAGLTEAERVLVQGYVEGFQAAPAGRMSASTLYTAASGEPEEQFRLDAGYHQLVAHLVAEARHAGAEIHLNTLVQTVRWRPHDVTVEAAAASWHGRVVIITVPLGVLKAPAGTPGAIRFDPPLSEKENVWRALDMGHALRLGVRMEDDFWTSNVLPEDVRGQGGENFGFMHSYGEAFPVWWAESPDPVLVGWCGGPRARELSAEPDEKLFRRALASLARLLGCSEIALRGCVVDWDLHNWSRDPYARGAYSFSTAGEENAPGRLAEPVAETLFFAGEATASSLELGTVHGALESGRRVAREVAPVMPVRT